MPIAPLGPPSDSLFPFFRSESLLGMTFSDTPIGFNIGGSRGGHSLIALQEESFTGDALLHTTTSSSPPLPISAVTFPRGFSSSGGGGSVSPVTTAAAGGGGGGGGGGGKALLPSSRKRGAALITSTTTPASTTRLDFFDDRSGLTTQTEEVDAILEPRAAALGRAMDQFYSGPRFIQDPACLHLQKGTTLSPGLGGIFALARDRWRSLISMLVDDVKHESFGLLNGATIILRAPGTAITDDIDATMLFAVQGGTTSTSNSPILDFIALPTRIAAILSRAGRLLTGLVVEVRLPSSALSGLAWPVNATLGEPPPPPLITTSSGLLLSSKKLSTSSKKKGKKISTSEGAGAGAGAGIGSSSVVATTTIPVSNVVVRAPIISSLKTQDLLWVLGAGKNVTFLYDICQIATPIIPGLTSTTAVDTASGSRHMVPNRDDFLSSITLDLTAWAAVSRGKPTKHARDIAEKAIKAIENEL